MALSFLPVWTATVPNGDRDVARIDSSLLKTRKYTVLLVLLMVSLVVETFNARGEFRLVSAVISTILTIVIWAVVFDQPPERKRMGVLLVVALGIYWLQLLSGSHFEFELTLAEQAAKSIFEAAAVYLILRDLLRDPSRGAEDIVGAICGYLIAGYVWASLNAIAYLLAPSAYTIDPSIMTELPGWHARTSLFTYYAFSQVTALGYSFVTPVRAPATTLSLFATLFGMFYMAVVVSLFINLAQSERK